MDRDQVPVNKELLTGSVPVNSKLLTGRVPVNKELLTGTVPVNNSIQIGRGYFPQAVSLCPQFLKCLGKNNKGCRQKKQTVYLKTLSK